MNKYNVKKLILFTQQKKRIKEKVLFNLLNGVLIPKIIKYKKVRNSIKNP